MIRGATCDRFDGSVGYINVIAQVPRMFDVPYRLPFISVESVASMIGCLHNLLGRPQFSKLSPEYRATTNALRVIHMLLLRNVARI